MKCPKCGHLNETPAANCFQCHVNLAWAIEHWDQHVEAEAKREAAQAQQRQLARTPAESRWMLKVGVILYLLLGFPIYILASSDVSDEGLVYFQIPILFLTGLLAWGFTNLTLRTQREPNPEAASQLPGLQFWVLWVLASTIGIGGWLLLGTLQDTPAVAQFGPLGRIAFAGLIGISPGIAQWVVIRRQAEQTTWWIAACAIGFAAGQPWEAAIGVDGSIIALPIVQWFGLRQQVQRAGWWIPGSMLGWVIARLVAYLSLLTMGAILGTIGSIGFYTAVYGATFGALFGATSGIVLIWLLRRPASQISSSDEGSIVDMGVKKQKTIQIDRSPDAAYQLAEQALGRLRWKTDESDAQKGVLRARVGLNLLSAGEKVEIRIEGSGADDCNITVSSEPTLQTTMFDWGKNAQNIERFEEVLLSLV